MCFNEQAVPITKAKLCVQRHFQTRLPLTEEWAAVLSFGSPMGIKIAGPSQLCCA